MLCSKVLPFVPSGEHLIPTYFFQISSLIILFSTSLTYCLPFTGGKIYSKGLFRCSTFLILLYWTYFLLASKTSCMQFIMSCIYVFSLCPLIFLWFLKTYILLSRSSSSESSYPLNFIEGLKLYFPFM